MISQLRLALVVVSFSACATESHSPPVTPVTHWALADLGQGPLHATGLAASAATGHLWLWVPGAGLIEATGDGHCVSKIASGSAGLSDLGFTDVAVLPGDAFALPSQGEGYRFERDHGTVPFFCLVPGDDLDVLDNEAIGLDAASGTIYVAPVYRRSGQITSAAFEAYASADGHLVDRMDVMSTGVIAQGLAVDPERTALWAVDGGTLSRFTMAGALAGQARMAGVGDARGLALHGDQLFVLDGSDDSIRVFDTAILDGIAGPG